MIRSTTINADTSSNVAQSDSKIPPIVFTFELETGNEGIKTIIEPMLRTREVAQQRAIAEFLEHGYPKRFYTSDTWRTDLKLNQIVLIKGVKYKITQLNIVSDNTKCVVNFTGVHYG